MFILGSLVFVFFIIGILNYLEYSAQSPQVQVIEIRLCKNEQFIDALICISDLVMTEVINSFVVGHWTVARQMVDRHVSRCTTNVILVQNKKKNEQTAKGSL